MARDVPRDTLCPRCGAYWSCGHREAPPAARPAPPAGVVPAGRITLDRLLQVMSDLHSQRGHVRPDLQQPLPPFTIRAHSADDLGGLLAAYGLMRQSAALNGSVGRWRLLGAPLVFSEAVPPGELEIVYP